ncbi:MAG TPA: phasin family protein [Thermoanaerobaculia bacterium]
MQTTRTDVKQQVKKVQEGVLGSAHSVWLAGLGAFALAEEGGRELFDQLVDRGKKVEARGKKRVDQAKGEVERTRERVGKRVDELGEGLDRRVAEAMHRMGIPTRDEIGTLPRRIEELTARVGELHPEATRAAKPAAPVAARPVTATPKATPPAARKPKASPGAAAHEPLRRRVVGRGGRVTGRGVNLRPVTSACPRPPRRPGARAGAASTPPD